MTSQDQKLKEVFPEPPLVAYKVAPNHRNKLVRAKVPPKAGNMDSKIAVYAHTFILGNTSKTLPPTTELTSTPRWTATSALPSTVWWPTVAPTVYWPNKQEPQGETKKHLSYIEHNV